MERFNNNRGIAMIYMTLFLLVLGLLFFSLAIDLGLMAYVRSQGQTAVDAAALSAAAAIPNYNNTGGNFTQVVNLAVGLNDNNTVLNNGADITSGSVEMCTGDANDPTCPSVSLPVGGVKVAKTYSVPLYFSRFFNGGGSAQISVSAIGWLGGPAGLRPTLPVALCSQEINYDPVAASCNPSVTAEFSPNHSDNAGWWAKGSSANANQCRSYVSHPESIPFIKIGESINLNNGQVTSCHKEINDKFAACTESICRGPDSPTKQNCTAILPIITCSKSINQSKPVDGFAAMCIYRVVSTPASKSEITGNLNCNITAPDSIGGGPQFGIYPERAVLVR